MNNNIENNSEFIKSYFDAISANPFLPVFWIDSKGAIFNVNDAACRYLGYTADELKSMNINQIDTENPPEKVMEIITSVRQVNTMRFETIHRTKDGKLIDVEVIANNYKVDGNEFSFSYVFDISDKKQKERDLVKANREYEKLASSLEMQVLKNEEMFISAFKASQDAINFNDIETGIYLQVNDGFLNITGYSKEEVIGKSSIELNIWKNAEERAKLVKAVKENGYFHNFEADFVRKDGSIIHGIMSASIQEFRGRKVLLNVSKDITRIKKLENELKELNAELKNRIEEEVAISRRQQEIIFEQKKLADMGMMINAIAHQWRQPLNIIGLRTQELAESYHFGELTDSYVDEFEEKQMGTVEFLSSTIDDFRTFFKPDDSESEFDVSAEIIALLRLLEIQMLAKGIRAYVSYSCGETEIIKTGVSDYDRCKDGGILVKGYKGEFKQVITNLVYNSIYAIEEKYKTQSKYDGFVHVRISGSSNGAVIHFEDNGGGIPEDVKPHIFSPYFTTKSDGKGTGMGLYLAKLIIETHMKGTITVENTASGADFSINLPPVN